MNGHMIYICSPYRGEWTGEESENPNRERNAAYARAIINELLTHDTDGKIHDIVAPHLYYPQFSALGRERGLQMARERLELCDIMVVGERFGVSEGMDGEIKQAEQMGIAIRRIDLASEAGYVPNLLTRCRYCGAPMVSAKVFCGDNCEELWHTEAARIDEWPA